MGRAASTANSLVLLVDGNEDTRQMYGEYLRRLAYEIDEAEDGAEAFGKAVAHRPAIVATGAWLPLVDGLEFCNVLRLDPATAAIPVIVLTSDSSPNHIQLVKAAGADAVLLKPCLPEVLADQIRRLLDVSGQCLSRHDDVLLRRPPGHPRARQAPNAPPCDACGDQLKYIRSHFASTHRYQEQWDYFDCSSCQSTFEYRQRTRKLRRCSSRLPHLS